MSRRGCCTKTQVSGRQLDRRLKIESATANTDGNPGVSWTSPTVEWTGRGMKRKGVPRGERVAGALTVATIATRYLIPYDSTAAAITPQMRVVDQDENKTRNLTDVVIDPDGTYLEWIELVCLEDAG